MCSAILHDVVGVQSGYEFDCIHEGFGDYCGGLSAATATGQKDWAGGGSPREKLHKVRGT